MTMRGNYTCSSPNTVDSCSVNPNAISIAEKSSGIAGAFVESHGWRDWIWLPTGEWCWAIRWLLVLKTFKHKASIMNNGTFFVARWHELNQPFLKNDKNTIPLPQRPLRGHDRLGGDKSIAFHGIW